MIGDGEWDPIVYHVNEEKKKISSVTFFQFQLIVEFNLKLANYVVLLLFGIKFLVLLVNNSILGLTKYP